MSVTEHGGRPGYLIIDGQELEEIRPYHDIHPETRQFITSELHYRTLKEQIDNSKGFVVEAPVGQDELKEYVRTGLIPAGFGVVGEAISSIPDTTHDEDKGKKWFLRGYSSNKSLVEMNVLLTEICRELLERVETLEARQDNAYVFYEETEDVG